MRTFLWAALSLRIRCGAVYLGQALEEDRATGLPAKCWEGVHDAGRGGSGAPSKMTPARCMGLSAGHPQAQSSSDHQSVH